MNKYTSNDIAIIGMSMRFPKASDSEAYWDLLINKKSGISHLNDDELKELGISQDKIRNTKFVNAGSVIDNPYHWDASFFGYSPKAASILDPQQRLLLECAWELVEQAGYSPLNIKAQTGVYLSVANNNYAHRYRAEASQSDDYIAFTSNDADFASTRISYHLNLKGPSMTVETACSSSLVAVHMACESLLNHETEMAICGGASLLFPQAGYIYDPNLIFSPDGLCRPFDKEARGTVFGNGIGLILIKRLKDAIDQKDNIHAIIKGSAINNDGRVKNSFYSPSPEGQKMVIKEALAVSEVPVESIGYIETHGTATPIGDPIEIEALTEVFREQTSNNAFCYIGSVKSNLGHLNKAAGIAGLIKAVLSLKNRRLPATLNFISPNPEIDFTDTPFIINSETIEWKTGSYPRRAGVSSFGVGGTNAHIILEEAPLLDNANSSSAYYILPVSAKNEEYLADYKIKLAEYIRRNSHLSMPDIAFTLQESHADYSFRDYVICTNQDQFIEWLESGKAPELPGEAGSNILQRWKEGQRIDWKSLRKDNNGSRKMLPSHSWIKAIYNIEDYTPRKQSNNSRLLPLVGENISTFRKQIFQTKFSPDEYLIQEHNFILPAAAYIEMIAEAIQLSGEDPKRLGWKNIIWKQAFSLQDHHQKALQISLNNTGEEIYINFTVGEDNENRSIAEGLLYLLPSDTLQPETNAQLPLDINGIKALSGQEVYSIFQNSGFRYGEHFRLIEKVFRKDNTALSYINFNYTSPDKNNFIIDPLLIDAAFQTAVSLLPCFDTALELYVPYQLKEARFYKLPDNNAKIVAYRLSQDATTSTIERFNIAVFDEQDNICMDFSQFELVQWNRSQNKVKSSKDTNGNADTGLIEEIEKLLKQVIGEELGYELSSFNSDESFESLGLDSVILVNVINKLDKNFPGLSKTLFFEYSNITDAAQYLIDNYAEICMGLLGKQEFEYESDINENTLFFNKQPIQSKVMVSHEEQFQYKQERDNDIAIIGVHGMYPEAGNLEAFWENLKSAKDCIREIPRDRWPVDGFYGSDINRMDTSFTKWGGFMDKVEYFDPMFFKIAPKEASYIDPQERLFLESSWCCVENAGYTPKNICDENRKVGVYAGVMWGHYQLFAMEEYLRGEIVVNTSNYWSIPNRVSFTMNFNGPSIAVDSACSSSLSAIHLACQSILNGESDLAIAGGVNLNLHPYKHYILSARRFASTDGRCRSFGKDGSGYVPGEGVGTVLLKPLSKAIKDKDFIHAVIKGSAINHGGKVSGYTVPNPNAQASVVKTAFTNSRVSPSDISYIEAHGTGTSLGDPIEMNGLARAYADSSYEKQNCSIGSVKSNIGHLESAAGVASIHKVILQLNYKTLVPSIHNDPANPYIDFENSPFHVQKKIEEWKPSKTYSKRLAGISSFGAGGANAHVVVEEAPQYSQGSGLNSGSSEVLIVLSAQDESTLVEYAKKMVDHINNPGYTHLSLASFAYTLQTGRIALEHRLAFTASSLHEIKEKFQSFIEGNRNNILVSKLDKTLKLPAANYISDLLRQQNLEELAQAWSIGATINWELLYKDNNAGRIPLPYYPFNKRRLWYKNLQPNEPLAKILGNKENSQVYQSTLVANDTSVKPVSVNKIKPSSENALPLNYFRISLKEAPLPINVNRHDSTLVFFSQDQNDFHSLGKFYQNGKIWVKAGSSFIQDHNGYTLSFFKPDTYTYIYNDLISKIQTAEIDIVINADSLFSPDYNLIVDFYRHIKQLGETFKKKKLNILLFWTSGNKNEAAYKALGSFAKVASKENNRLNIRTVEFRNTLSTESRFQWITSEINNPEKSKREAVYIGNTRFEYSVGTLVEKSENSKISIQPGGIYLVTGGMGAIGITTARMLISKGAQKVILSGRKLLDNLSPAQKELIHESNGKIGYQSADIADPISTQMLISSITSQYGKLNGIIHSAGIVDDKLLLKKSEESFISVTGPKVKGALNIDRALSGISPDFVIFYSSVSSVAGQMGQSDYSTANRFLDEFASYKNSTSSIKHIAVNWPYWNEGGMKLATPYIDMMRNSGIDGITDYEGMEALETILKSGHDQVIVFKGNEKGCKGFFNDTHFDYQPNASHNLNPLKNLPINAEVEINKTSNGSHNSSPFLVKENTREIITSILSEALGLAPEEIDSNASLEEYGVDSVAIMKVTSELEKLFPEISIALFFECKSINDIVAKIDSELAAGTLSYRGNFASIDKGNVLDKNISEAKTLSVQHSSDDLINEVRDKIIAILSEALGLSPSEMDITSDLEEYGVDSVAIMKVTSELEKLFPEISIALFFECKSINDIVSRISEELHTGTLTYQGNLAIKTESASPKPQLKDSIVTKTPERTLSIVAKVNKIILEVLSEALGMTPDEISTSTDLEEYGVDSVAIMKVTSELEKHFTGVSIALFFECKTIDDISDKISVEVASGNLIHLSGDQYAEVTSDTHYAEHSKDISPLNKLSLSDEVKKKITDILSEALGLTTEEIDTSASLEDYGVDSVAIMKVTAELEKLFPEISIALFFECKSIDDIVVKINEELRAGMLTYLGKSIEASSEQSHSFNQKIQLRKPYYTLGSFNQEANNTKLSVTLDGNSPELTDHQINGQVIFAGAGYLDLVKKVSETHLNNKVNTFRNISWFSPLIIQGEVIPLEIDFIPKGGFRQYSFKSVQKPLAKGEIGLENHSESFILPISQLTNGFVHKINRDEVYQWFQNNNFYYGPAFQTIEELYVAEGRVTGRLKRPVNSETWLSPMILDGVFQCIVGLTVRNSVNNGELWVPFFIEKMSLISERLPSELWVRVEKDNFSQDANLQQFNIYLIDAAGRIYLEIRNFTLKSFNKKKEKPKGQIEPSTESKTLTSAKVTTEKIISGISAMSPEPIAVIASSCKFPGADTPEEFWKNLVEERDVVTEIPLDRWDYRKSFDPLKGQKGKTYSKWGGFIKNIDAFDNDFFKIKENDAMCLDPQQRILLELSQHLFDRAGYTKAEIANKNIAVIIGGASGHWGQLIEKVDDGIKQNVVVNTIQNMIAARISDFYDLKGTSLTIDTACSSSLVAVHEACQKIRSGECEMAIAGGITFLLGDGGHIGFSQAQVLSPEGKCNVFDKNANGIVLGEGAGIVLLKSYKKAMQDGDQIYSVIRGSAVNNDGKTMGITTPNMLMQKEVIKMALDYSGLEKQSITYLEAHGTGTLLGDPIEVKAAGQVYGEGHQKKQYCAVASVKSNIGHLLHASGIASLIKVSMALKYKTLPASLNCKVPHPRFEFENSPFYPVTATKAWETDMQPRRAAISSFGFGGTNCHLIMEEPDSAYVPTRNALPLTQFRKKRFWPGVPVEFISEKINETELPDNKTINSIKGYNEIIEKLEKGLITVEEALEFEKSLK